MCQVRRVIASTARSLLVVLAVMSVVGLAQGAGGPPLTEPAAAAPSAALPAPTPTLPPPASYTAYLPRVTHTVTLPPRFQVIPSPDFGAESTELNSVDLLSPTEGWAVGDYDGHHKALILHWDGVRWAPVASPPNDATWQAMSDVVAITPSDAWASPAQGRVLFHWTGQAWQSVIVDLGPGFVPPQFAMIDSLDATGPNDVWAVGAISEATAENHTETLILHWDGSRWTRVPSPNPSPHFSLLKDVVAVAPNEAWAVGLASDEAQGGGQPVILHWDGAAWHFTPPPGALHGSEYDLLGVAALAANDVWAVGLYRIETWDEMRPVSLHWDGVRWSVVPVPAPSGDVRLVSVAGLAPDNVLAVGRRSIPDGDRTPYLVRWNGAAWTTVTDAPGLTPGRIASAVAVAAPSTALVVGTQQGEQSPIPEYTNDRPWLLQWSGTAWREVNVPGMVVPRNRLNGVAAVSPTDVWAVGNYQDVTDEYTPALLLHWDGQAWTRFDLPHFDWTSDILVSAAALSSTDVWAVGGLDDRDTPLAVHWNGVQWTRSPLPPLSRFLNAVAARASDDVWAVGYNNDTAYDQPLIVHWDGNVWATRPAPSLTSGDATLLDVAPLARDNVWAVGWETDLVSDQQRPLILHWDGGRWSQLPAPTDPAGDVTLACVTASAPDNVWAMGRYKHGDVTEAVALRWDGAAWTEAPRPALNGAYSRVEDCLALGPREVYAVGWVTWPYQPEEALVLRWDGVEWTRLASPNPGGRSNRLAALALAGDSLWTVGHYAQWGWDAGVRATLVERAFRNGYPTQRP